MHETLLRLLAPLTGHAFGQRVLERLTADLQHLMGHGVSGAVETSGEAGMFKLLPQLAAPPYCIFDVGANTGQFAALTLRNLPAADCDLHLFEPSPEAFAQLARNISAPRARLNQCALGQAAGEARLYYDRPGSALASLTRRQLAHFGIAFDLSEIVPVRTVDDYCAEAGIAAITLLKLDVEGHELEVLTGAAEMLRRDAIRVVAFEFGGCNLDSRTYWRDFFYFFQRQGKTLYRVTPTGYLHPLRQYKELYECFRLTNYVAL